MGAMGAGFEQLKLGLAVVLSVGVVACGGEELDVAAEREGLSGVVAAAAEPAAVVLDRQRLDARRAADQRLDPEALRGLPEPGPAAPAPYEDGDLCTFGPSLWAADCNPDSPSGCVRQLGFASLYPEGLGVGFNGNGVGFSSEEALVKALPGLAPIAVMTRWQEDPGRHDLNALASQLVALRLNVDFNAHGLHGRAALAEALIAGGPFEGLLVGEVLEMGEWALGGFEGGIARRGVDLEGLTAELARLNHLSADCAATSDLTRLPGR